MEFIWRTDQRMRTEMWAAVFLKCLLKAHEAFSQCLNTWGHD